MEKKNILVFFGGKSFEHDISIITAVMMIKNYKHGKYNLLPVYISKNNEWFFYSKNEIDVKLFKDFENSYKAKGFIPAYFKNGVNALFFKSKLFEKKIEVYGALNCCHGGIGEDGNLSSFMKVCNIPLSTGNSVSMGLCMDKYVSKLAFDGLKIKNLPYVMMEKDFDEMKKKEAILSIRKIGFPVIIKPASLGSSIGISLAYNEEELHSGLALAFEFDSRVIIEKAVIDQMKEYNVACLRSKDKILVSEADEAVKSDEILSFKDKYIGNDIVKDKTGKKPQKKCGGYLAAKKDFPAKIPESLRKKLQNMSTYTAN